MRRSLILSASNSCFVACPGCYNHFAKTLAPTELLVAFVRELTKRGGLSKVTVGGGDPLTRPDIVGLLQAFRDMKLRINLDTVGTAFLRDAPIRFMGRGRVDMIDPARVVPLVDLLGIPLDGSTDVTARLFRRFSSVSDQKEILSRLDRLGASVCINTVVHAGNFADLPAIASIICHHPCVQEWQLFQFMPIGPLGHRNRERFVIDEDQFLKAVSPLDEQLFTRLRVSIKSASLRKHRYVLVDSAGVAWTPRQNESPLWSPDDTNEERIVLGSLDDPATIEKVLSADV